MTTLTVTYPRAPGATFDYAYYEQTHLPLVRARWDSAGLKALEALRGVSAADGGEASFLLVALLRFDSPERLQAVLGGEHAAEIVGDIANFTNVQPIFQVNETVGS